MTKKVFEIANDEHKTKDLQAFARTIQPFAKKMLGAKGLIEVDILSNWEAIAGEELAAYTLPQRIDFRKGEKNNGVLHIAVPGGAFALELQHREKFIISKVNAYFGYNAVAQIRIVQNNYLSLDNKDDDKSERVEKTLVTKEEENYIRDLSCEVENPALKEALIKLGCCVVSNNKGENNKK